MKKVVCFVLAIIMMLSMTVTAFAAGNNNSENAPHIDPIFDLVDEISMVPQNGTLTTTTESIVVTGTISDADKIQALINEGIVECGLNGELPTKVVVTQIIDNTALNEKTVVPQATAPTTPISITKSNFFDGRYFEEYDRYMIDGPSEFTETYMRPCCRRYIMKIKNEPFFVTIRSFFEIYLVKNRSCSPNTVKSYKDAMNL